MIRKELKQAIRENQVLIRMLLDDAFCEIEEIFSVLKTVEFSNNSHLEQLKEMLEGLQITIDEINWEFEELTVHHKYVFKNLINQQKGE